MIKTGMSRIVIAIPWLGITLKIARIRLYAAAATLFYDITHDKKLARLKKRLAEDMQQYGSLKFLIAGGVVANLSEHAFFARTRDALLQPTYFSFFGIANVQRYSPPSEDAELFLRIISAIGEEAARSDLHHFSNPSNFTTEGGRFRILDYGSRETQLVLRMHGEKLRREFGGGLRRPH